MLEGEECEEGAAPLEEALGVHAPALGGVVGTHDMLADEDRVLLVPDHQDLLPGEVAQADNGAVVSVVWEQRGGGGLLGEVGAVDVARGAAEDDVICSGKAHHCDLSVRLQHRL